MGNISPKKYGSAHYNCKGFFSLVVVALVDTEYRFLRVDDWSSGSTSEVDLHLKPVEKDWRCPNISETIERLL